MKLKEFIRELEKIHGEHDRDLQVIMADGLPVVKPVCSDKYSGNSVVITDEK